MLRKPAGSRRVFRITAIIPVILSLFAFALTFLAVVAGQEPGLLMDDYIYSVFIPPHLSASLSLHICIIH